MVIAWIEETVPIVFHFNKAHNSNTEIPPWVVKCRGVTYYVHHLDSKVGFSTKETPENETTKAALKFKGRLVVEEENGKIIATVY